jgi:putative intracellular protease/amidase
MAQLRGSVPLDSITQPAAYAALYLAGGQGAMGDMPGHAQLAELLRDAAARGAAGPRVLARCLCTRALATAAARSLVAHMLGKPCGSRSKGRPRAPRRPGAVIAAVSHGPAGLLGVQGPDGRPLLQGRRVACFTQVRRRAVRFCWEDPRVKVERAHCGLCGL